MVGDSGLRLTPCLLVPTFTHLRVASCFTTHHGTAYPEALVAAAVAAGADAVAITDRDGIYGAIRHVRACLRAGTDPILSLIHI